MRTMMITGDYHHTAISVAKDVGMLTADSQVLVIDAVQQPQAFPLPPSASAKESQASTDHPKSADTVPAVVQQQAVTALQLSHGSYTAVDCRLSQGLCPGYTHKHEQTLEAGADCFSPKHVAWSQEGPFSGPGHARDGQSHAVDVQRHAVDEQGHFQQPAGMTAHHVVRQSQVAAWSPPAGTTPAGITSPNPQAASLRFVIGDDDTEWDAMQALTALAEGRVQCAVTGEAFQVLLQLPDVSALGAVMRNVVVFARMKPLQKGQVIDLLNARGLHQMHEGKPRHIQVYNSSTPFSPPQTDHPIVQTCCVQEGRTSCIQGMQGTSPMCGCAVQPSMSSIPMPISCRQLLLLQVRLLKSFQLSADRMSD